MKHILEISFFKNHKYDKGNAIVARILNIMKEYKIKLEYTGGYRVHIADRFYSFARYGVSESYVSIYNISQENRDGFVFGQPISKYIFSDKLWRNELDNVYNGIAPENFPVKKLKLAEEDLTESYGKFEEDLENLSDERLTATKYNL